MYHVSVDERMINVHYYYYFTESQRETGWGGGGGRYILPLLKPVLNWANVCSPEQTSDTSTNYDSSLN